MNDIEELYELTNKDIYLEKCNFFLNDSCNKYMTLMNHYIILCNENKLTYEEINKGFDILSNIYIILLQQTKNLDVAAHYINNSIFLYIEYLEQIKQRDSEFVFVNLTLKDAITYIYRKSVYSIPLPTKKKDIVLKEEISLNNILISHTFEFSKIYNYILKYFVNLLFNNDSNNSNDKMLIVNHLYEINSICELLCDEDWIKKKYNIQSVSIILDYEKLYENVFFSIIGNDKKIQSQSNINQLCNCIHELIRTTIDEYYTHLTSSLY